MTSTTHHPRLGDLFVLTAVCLSVVFLSGCGAMGWKFRSPITRDRGEPRVGPGKMTPADIQSEVQSFTDTFNSTISQQWNAVANAGRAAEEAKDGTAGAGATAGAAMRRVALIKKLTTASAALSIASSPNPTVAVGDMITMVTLERMLLEETALKRFGAALGLALVQTYQDQEDKIWRVAEKAMTPEQREELRGLIQAWRDANPNITYVANVRLEDFASTRGQVFVDDSESGGSLLSLLALDPLAGLDPAQREVQKSRLLAERMFFYASRSPQIVKWQAESLFQDIVRAPEVKRVIESVDKATQSAARISVIAEQLPKDIANERTAAIDQLFEKLSRERHAALVEVNEHLTAQRDAILRELDGSQGQMQGTLVEVRKVVEITDAAAKTLTSTFEAADALAARFAPPAGSPAAADEPKRDVLAEVGTALTKAGDAADRLTVLTQNLDRLLKSPALDEKSGALHTAMVEVQLNSKQVIDYAFTRLLVLALVGPFAVAVAAGVYRLVFRRAV